MLSIIIVNYNAKDFLFQCLKSIERADKPNSYEIIIVDNNSIDSSKIMIKKEFPDIKLIENIENIGFAKANNQGIKLSQGNYILLLNPDTVIYPNTLSRTIEFLNSNPKIGVVTCYVELADGKIDPACHRGFPTPWASFCYFIGLEKLFPKSRILGGYHLGWLPLSTIHEIDTPSGCFYLVRREVIEQVGLLDESYFLFYEEVDWSYRIKQAGWKIYYFPEVKITHYKGISSGIKKNTSKLSRATKEIKRNAINSFCDSIKIFYDKHYKDKYPLIITWFIYLGVWIKRKINLLRLAIS
ncbi:MAG: glycosyltransferase family 2 protein [candidate division WOR-3 bacterium]